MSWKRPPQNLAPRGAVRARRSDDEDSLLLQIAANAHAFYLEPSIIWLAAELAGHQSELNPVEHEVVTIVLVALWLATQEGNGLVSMTEVSELSKLIAELFEPFEDGTSPDPVDVATKFFGLFSSGRLNAVVGTSEDPRAAVYDGTRIALATAFRAQHELDQRLAERLAVLAEVGEELDAAIEYARQRSAFEPSVEQLAAIRRAATQPTTVISGGPGTGKTSIVVSLLRTLVHQGLAPEQIALAAPTGKAANRMWESIRDAIQGSEEPHPVDEALLAGMSAPMTMHRLLSYSPYFDRFRRDASNPLRAHLVVIDETSMVDVVMMNALLAAVLPTTRLIFLGDADQLPPVNMGAPFQQIVDTHDETDLVVRLRESFRMREDDPAGRNILQVAQAVNTLEGEELDQRLYGQGGLVRVVSNVAELRYEGVERLVDVELTEFLEEWYREHVSLAGAGIDEHRDHELFVEQPDGGFTPEANEAIARIFDHYARSRVLTSRRVGRGGSDAVNRALHLMHEGENGGVGVLSVGEPVIVTTNSYELDLFNGDQGIVLKTRLEPIDRRRVRCVFPARDGGWRSVDPSRVAVEQAFALTIHRSQGSQYDVVAVLAHDGGPQLQYTAITRAARGVVLPA